MDKLGEDGDGRVNGLMVGAGDDGKVEDLMVAVVLD